MKTLFSLRGIRSAAALFLLFSAVDAEKTQAQPGRGAPPSGRITGSVVDNDSGDPIPGAAVAVWNGTDSTLVTGVIVRPDGGFVVEGLRPGPFYLKVTSLGYTPLTVPDINIRSHAPRVDLGRVSLFPDSAGSAETVVVSAERSDVEFHSDRTVYNVENQPATAGGNTVDVLKNVPQVQVDANDQVSLRGSQNVAVHVNGRPVPLSGEGLAGYLKAIPADMIKSVEVIPNPSAKYDPDGMAGIINIVLKGEGNAGGASGNISLSGSTTNSYSGNGSLAWRTNRLGIFAGYSFQYDERRSDATQYQVNKLVAPNVAVDITTASSGITRAHTFNGTLDYNLTEDNSSILSYSTILTVRGGLIEEKNNYLYRDNGGELPGDASRFSFGGDDWFDMDHTISWRKVFESGRHELSTEARYISNFVETRRDLTEWPVGPEGVRRDSATGRQENELDNFSRMGRFRLDYTRPIGEKGRLESGYEGEISRIDNTFYSESFNPQAGEFQPDLNLNNEFEYDMQTHGVYATYGHAFGKFDAQVGLRAEQAYTDFILVTNNETFTNDYFSLFPSASLLWSPDETRRVQLSYSKRINRPRTWQLNPFVNYEDRLNLNKGNPHLKPEYLHSVEIGLNQFTPWGSLSLTPYFRHRNNMIERWSTIDTSGVSTIQFENFNTTNTFGAEFVATYRIGSLLRGFGNASLYHFDLDGSNVRTDVTNRALGWSAYVSSTWTPTPGLDVQAGYFYRAPIKIVGGKLLPYQTANIAVKKSLFGDRASLTLNVNDIFNTEAFDLYKDDPTFYTDLGWTWTSQQATLTFAWNFGKQDPGLMRRPRGGGDGGGSEGAPGGMGI